MTKNNKLKLIITSLIIILPVVVGLILWQKLPAQMVVHWNADGRADGFASKPFTVFIPALFMLAVHWVCVLVTAADPKNKNIGKKPFGLVLWICPAMSVVVYTLIYAQSLGANLSVEIIMQVILGLMFAVIGNYLPKCRQNYTVGIKVPWALSDDKNWNSTHRFAGRLWMIGGAVIILTSFLGNILVFAVILVVMAILPVLYSYLYYRKK